MRVLHVDTAREWRGGQTQLLDLLRARPGDEAVVCPDAPLRSALEEIGVRVHLVAFRGTIRGTRRLGRVVRAARPDLVAAHTGHAHHHAWLGGGAKVVVHRRNDFVPSALSLPRYRAASACVAVSGAVRDVLVASGVPAARVCVVHDGCDLARFGPSGARALRGGDGVFRIGALGALVPHKGHATLVHALAWLRARGVPARVVVAGEGPCRDALQALARRLGVSAWLDLPGAVDDAPAFLRSLDVFAHPSLEEGFGQAVVEARLVGAPVVASAAGGLPEAVDGHGALVPPGHPAALGQALRRIWDEPGRALTLADHGRIAARRFSVEAMVAATEAAYASVLAAG